MSAPKEDTMGRIYHSYSNETGEFSDEGRDGPNLFAALMGVTLVLLIAGLVWVAASLVAAVGL